MGQLNLNLTSNNAKNWQPSKLINDFVKQQEGLKLETYTCASGVLTIGYGHTKNVKEGQKITIEEAEQLYLEDIKETTDNLNRRLETLQISTKIQQHHFDALFSLSFNCGLKATQLILHRFKQLGDNNYCTPIAEVAKYNQYKIMPERKKILGIETIKILMVPTYLFLFRMWINVNGLPVKGLFNRRTAEAGIFCKRQFMLIE